CLGNPAAISYRVQLTYDTSPGAKKPPLAYDVLPDQGMTGPVPIAVPTAPAAAPPPAGTTPAAPAAGATSPAPPSAPGAPPSPPPAPTPGASAPSAGCCCCSAGWRSPCGRQPGERRHRPPVADGDLDRTQAPVDSHRQRRPAHPVRQVQVEVAPAHRHRFGVAVDAGQALFGPPIGRGVEEPDVDVGRIVAGVGLAGDDGRQLPARPDHHRRPEAEALADRR